MLSEAKANDLHELMVANLVPNLTDQARNEIFEDLKRRQPRRHRPFDETVPPEVLKRFEEKWNAIKRKQKQSG